MLTFRAAILAFVCVLPAAAQTVVESDLAARHPDVHWPAGHDPATADLFAHNSIDIGVPCSSVWTILTDARRWPSWYANSADIRMEDARLDSGTAFRWKTFGLQVESQVMQFVPPQRLAWSGLAEGVSALHTWLLVPRKGGCEVVTEEVVMGEGARKWRQERPTAMHDGHEAWLRALKGVAER